MNYDEWKTFGECKNSLKRVGITSKQEIQDILDSDVVMLGERHHEATHRNASLALLRSFARCGYVNLADEALSSVYVKDGRLKSGTYPSRISAQEQDVDYLEMIEGAERVGYRVSAYEGNYDFGPARERERQRDLEQAINIKSIVNKFGKTVSIGGQGHIRDKNYKLANILEHRLHLNVTTFFLLNPEISKIVGMPSNLRKSVGSQFVTRADLADFKTYNWSNIDYLVNPNLTPNTQEDGR